MENEEIEAPQKEISTGNEILRFIITGLACAIVDLLTMTGVMVLLNEVFGLTEFWATAIATTAGFLLGVTLNYILSTYWVFKNVKDKDKTKTPKFIIAFVLLSAGAWALSVGTQELCSYICRTAWDISIDAKVIDILMSVIKFTFWGDAKFWCYIIAFGLRTLVGLVWNYLTRKFILYK